MTTAKIHEITFSDADIANLDDIDYCDGQAFLVHDHGFVQGIAFASNLSDALDHLADADKLEAWKLSDDEVRELDADDLGECISYHGNHSEAFHLDTMEYVEMPRVKLSYTASFNDRPGEPVSVR